jgi:hypothetical protein
LSGFSGLCKDLVTNKVKLIIHFFVKHCTQGKKTTLIVYVDNIIVIENNDGEIRNLKKSLANKFEIIHLDNLKYFLGIEVTRSKHGIFIPQRKYIIDLLKET